MMNPQIEKGEDYQQLVGIDTTKEKVFDALTAQIAQWWGKVDRPVFAIGDVFKVHFGSEESYWKFEVIDLNASTKIVWKCVASHQDHNLKGIDKEWLGSQVHWEMSEKEGGVEVKFIHQGLLPHGDCYDVCSTAWDFYITDSLKNYLETGIGKPEDY